MRKYFTLLLLAVLALGTTSLEAVPIHWELDYEFSGAHAPVGTLIVELETTATNTVWLTVDATGLVGGEHVKVLCLNLDDTLLPRANLGMTDEGSGYTVDTFSVGIDAYKADGDGYFDMEFAFGTSGGNRLAAGEKAEFEFTWPGGLDQSAFYYGSAPPPGGGPGPFYVAAHVGGIADDEGGTDWSGWVTDDGNGEVPVPEASTMILFGSGLVGLLRFAKRKSRFFENR
jgi:hypothetical protein